MSMTREEANKCLKSLMRVLIIKEGDKYRPAKDTSRQDAYRALYEIQEALGTRRIEREEALLENMQDLELALSALRPVSWERVEKVWRGCSWCNNEGKKSENWECSLLDDRGFSVVVGDEVAWTNAEFCPVCGKPLTDEAVEMVMERWEALHGETKTD